MLSCKNASQLFLLSFLLLSPSRTLATSKCASHSIHNETNTIEKRKLRHDRKKNAQTTFAVTNSRRAKKFAPIFLFENLFHFPVLCVQLSPVAHRRQSEICCPTFFLKFSFPAINKWEKKRRKLKNFLEWKAPRKIVRERKIRRQKISFTLFLIRFLRFRASRSVSAVCVWWGKKKIFLEEENSQFSFSFKFSFWLFTSFSCALAKSFPER